MCVLVLYGRLGLRSKNGGLFGYARVKVRFSALRRIFFLLFFNQCFSSSFFNSLFLLFINGFLFFFSSITYETSCLSKNFSIIKTFSQLKLKLYKRRSPLLFFRLLSRKSLYSFKKSQKSSLLFRLFLRKVLYNSIFELL